MFRSIQYKLIIYLALLVAAVAAAVWLFIAGQTIYGCVAVAFAVFAVWRMSNHYRNYNLNILFLLNALENGDYSFHFSVTKLSRREKELNAMLNRIKDILAAARREVMDNERFLGLVVESVSTGIVITDDNGGVRRANAAAMRMLGMNVFTHIKQLAGIDPSLPPLLDSLSPEDKAQVHIPNEREEQSISLQMNRIELKKGGVRVFILSNIGSELEAQEMESWIKLIRVMTHEIMNAVAPITSLSDTLLTASREPGATGGLSATTTEALETINSTARGLLSFVESYRKFTGIATPELRPVSLNRLLMQAATLFGPSFSEKGIGLAVEMPGDEVMAMGDESQISQVVANLLRNASEAVEGIPGGSIRVECAVEGGHTCISVSDNGQPIPPETLPHIFVPFFTTKQSGSGIGLSVSRYIMRLHGGNLTHHRTGDLTVFRMTFP